MWQNEFTDALDSPPILPPLSVLLVSLFSPSPSSPLSPPSPLSSPSPFLSLTLLSSSLLFPSSSLLFRTPFFLSSLVFHWHDKWRSVKIDLSPDKLEASWSKGGVHRYWATFGGDLFFVGGKHYFEIEIIDLGKLRPKKKLAIGVIGCGRDNMKNIPWHDGRHAVGQWREFPSWSFHPISGVINSSSLPLEGKEYAHIALQDGDRIGVLANMEDGRLTFFCNGQDLGVAFDDVQAETLLPAVSIRDKIRVRLRFPPPPYSRRTSNLIHISSTGQLSVS